MSQQLREEFEQFLSKDLPKSYGQSQMFAEIWEERSHFSEISNQPLLPYGHFKWHWQMAHCLGKGSYPKMKLFKPNIMLVTPEEHNNQESFDFFNNKRELLNRVYYEVIYGKKF